MIAIVDYGMGNLRSVQNALDYLGCEAVLTSDKQSLRDAGHIILPGVGAAGDAVTNLEKRGLAEEIVRQAQGGKPFLGICLGMQLMLDKSLENGEHQCLGLIEGEVVPFRFAPELRMKVPHMGWNALDAEDTPLFRKRAERQYVYFVHSYYACGVPEENVIGRTDYGGPFVCAVRKENMFGLQFHPEKSGDVGLAMLEAFVALK